MEQRVEAWKSDQESRSSLVRGTTCNTAQIVRRWLLGRRHRLDPVFVNLHFIAKTNQSTFRYNRCSIHRIQGGCGNGGSCGTEGILMCRCCRRNSTRCSCWWYYRRHLCVLVFFVLLLVSKNPYRFQLEKVFTKRTLAPRGGRMLSPSRLAVVRIHVFVFESFFDIKYILLLHIVTFKLVKRDQYTPKGNSGRGFFHATDTTGTVVVVVIRIILCACCCPFGCLALFLICCHYWMYDWHSYEKKAIVQGWFVTIGIEDKEWVCQCVLFLVRVGELPVPDPW